MASDVDRRKLYITFWSIRPNVHAGTPTSIQIGTAEGCTSTARTWLVCFASCVTPPRQWYSAITSLSAASLTRTIAILLKLNGYPARSSCHSVKCHVCDATRKPATLLYGTVWYTIKASDADSVSPVPASYTRPLQRNQTQS